MKTTTTLLAVLVALASGSAFAALDVPKKVFPVKRLDEAIAKAKSEKKAVSLVFSQANTTCGICIAASSQAFKALDDHSIVVLVNSGVIEELALLSPPVFTALNEDSFGNTIPWAVVMSPDLTEPWDKVKHEDMTNAKAYRAVEKSVKARLAQPVDAAPATPAAAGERGSVFKWFLNSGQMYIGSFVRASENSLYLKTPEGHDQKVPLAELGPGVREYVNSLKKQAAGGSAATGDPAATKSAQPEKWSNTSGKVIEATFVSLQNGQVTLQLPDGKPAKVALTSLSPESRARAEAAAAR